MNSLAVIGVPSGLQYRALAFVDDDKVEEIRRVVAEVGRRFAVLIFATAHEGLEDGEKDARVLGHPAFLGLGSLLLRWLWLALDSRSGLGGG